MHRQGMGVGKVLVIFHIYEDGKLWILTEVHKEVKKVLEVVKDLHSKFC